MKKFLIFFPILAFSISLIKTPHADIFFPSWLEYAAEDLACSVETYWASVTNAIGNDPKHITIYLGYSGNYVNGFADPIGKRIVVVAYPMPSKFLNFEDWYSTVFVHEFTHISHLTMRKGMPRIVYSATGVPLLDAEFRSPFVESTTVYDESTLVKGGRLRNPLINSLIESSTAGGWIPSLVRASDPPAEDFLGRSVYYYIPSYFYKYLVEKFSVNKMRIFLKELSKRPFGIGINSVSEKAFGKKLEKLYEDWKGSLKIPKRSEKTIFEMENGLILDMYDDGKDIWIALKKFGKSSLYKNDGAKIGKIEDGKFKEEFSVYGYAGNLKVYNGKIYYLVYSQTGKCCKFPYLKSSIAVWKGKEKIIKSGNITAFDVKNGKVYFSEYDPKSGKSLVTIPSGKLIINGIVREMVVTSKTYLLVSRKGESSVLWIDGKEIHDKRFKYSLKKCGNEICFLSFDGNNADLYQLDGDLMKITSGVSALDYVVRSDHIMVSMFSRKFPGTGIYEVKKAKEKVSLLKSIVKKKAKKFPIVNGTPSYIFETLKPVVHIPLIFPIDGKWKFSLITGGYSPRYDLFWILAPAIDRSGFSINGGIIIDTGRFDMKLYKIFDKFNASASLEIFRKRFDSDFILSANIYGKYLSTYEIGTYLNFIKGSIFGSMKLGFGEDSPSVSAVYGMGFDNLKMTLEYNHPENLKISVIFSMAETDIGTLDPYFHISHIFSEISLGYDKDLYIEAFLGIEEGDFLTYMRNFPKLGFRISKSRWDILFDFGM